MKDHYIYPAIFSFDADGISVEFPDLPGCLTCGDNEEEALFMARDVLKLHLYGLEEDNDDIPQPSSLSNLKLEQNQIPIFIEVWMPPFRDEMSNKAIKKTLTIPKWLNDLAEREKVNFSQILQGALKNYLGIDNYDSKFKKQP
jgi:predicted RNase H-like HicB family nuclease